MGQRNSRHRITADDLVEILLFERQLHKIHFITTLANKTCILNKDLHYPKDVAIVGVAILAFVLEDNPKNVPERCQELVDEHFDSKDGLAEQLYQDYLRVLEYVNQMPRESPTNV